jgi:hypothetical protein
MRAQTCVVMQNIDCGGPPRCSDTLVPVVWNAQSEEQARAGAEAGRNLLELLQPKSKLLPLMRNGAHHGAHQSGSPLSHDGVPPAGTHKVRLAMAWLPARARPIPVLRAFTSTRHFVLSAPRLFRIQ